MADIIEDNMLVEFSGDGQPTGNGLCAGVKYTNITSADVGSIPRIDGKSTTKVWVAHRVVFVDNLGTAPTHVLDRSTGKRKAIGWTKV